MPQAKITVNASPGSDTNLPINTLVQLDNINTGGELTYTWSILDQPPGPTDTLSSVSVQNPFFTPKKEGTYLIRLVVNQGLPDEQQDRVVAAIVQLKTLERIPAAGETTEADTVEGWATATNSYMRRIDTLLVDPGVLVGVNTSGGTLTRGQIVHAQATAVIKSGLPGQETLPGFSLAPSTLLANVDELLCIVEGTPSGGTSVPGTGTPENRLMKVRYIGRIASQVIANGPVTAGDILFVNDSAGLDKNEGTIRRRVASAMATGSTVDVWFDGVGGAEIDLTPIDRNYVVYGFPGTLPNAFRVDGTNASSVHSGNAYEIHTSDDTTPTLILRRHSSSGLDMQRWQTEGGSTLVSMSAGGKLTFAAGTVGIELATGVTLVQKPGSDTDQFTLTDSFMQINRRQLRFTDNDGFGNHLNNYMVYTYLGGTSRRGVDFVAQTGTGTATITLQSNDDGLGQVRNDIILAASIGTPLYITNQQGDLYLNTFQSGSTFLGMAGGGTFTISAAFTQLWQFTGAGALQAVGGNRPIHNVLDPLAAQDAVTKHYTDVHEYQNFVINGDFRYWQRNFTSVTAAQASPGTTRKNAADRWAITAGRGTGASTASMVMSRQTSAGPDSLYMARFTMTQPSAPYTLTASQEIDREMVLKLRGKKVSAVFKWRDDGVNTSALIRVELISGTGALTQNWLTGGGYTGSNTEVSVDLNPPTTLGTQVVTSTGTLPSGMTTLALVFYADSTMSSLWSAGGYFEVAEVMLLVTNDAGTVDTAIPFKLCGGDSEAELHLCKRYYEKSYEVDTDPASNVYEGIVYTVVSGTSPAATNSLMRLGYHPRFTVEKWRENTGAGSLVLYTPNSTGKWFFTGAGGDKLAYGDKDATGLGTAGFNTNGFYVEAGESITFTAGEEAHGHWAADAEI